MIVKNVPYYIQVANIIRDELKSGKYAAYSKFPDEMDLADRFNVSKDVIRQSRKLLCSENLIRTVKGKGTYVLEPRCTPYHNTVHLNCFQSTMHVMPIFRAVQDFTMANNFILSAHSTDVFDLENERTIINKAVKSGCKILVTSPSLDYEDNDNGDLYRKIIKKDGISLILIDRYVSGTDADMIYFDNETSAYNAIKELGEGNYDPQNLFIALPQGYRVCDARLEGILAGKKEFFPSMPSKNIYSPSSKWFKKDTEATVADIMCYLREKEIVPEVLVASQPIAWEVFNQLRKEKLHKSIKKIVSFADSFYSDSEFNDIHLGYYRIFDDLGKELKRVLETRFEEGQNTPPMIVPLLYQPLTTKEAKKHCLDGILP